MGISTGFTASAGLAGGTTSVEVGASAMSGLAYGALLTPTLENEDFLSSRARNAFSSAATFMTLSTSSRAREVGFANYHHEWWHFDYGTQMWVMNGGHCGPALFGRTTLSPGTATPPKGS